MFYVRRKESMERTGGGGRQRRISWREINVPRSQGFMVALEIPAAELIACSLA